MNIKEAEKKNTLKIGNVVLKSKVILAPMAGITDIVLRQIVRKLSPESLVMSEMVSAEALRFNKEQSIINTEESEKPISFQLSGHKPDLMAEGAKKLESIATFIDINMGCPAPKITRNGDGVSLMKDLPLASKLISAVKNAVEVPVTVKFRLGWDFHSKNYIEFAKMAEDSGADAIIVHGRTKSQMYSGNADWNAIGEVKAAVSIPVIGNGDIDSPQKAQECIDASGCDGIAVGRGILGDPGLIARIDKFLATGEVMPPPSYMDRAAMALLHTKKEIEYRTGIHGIKYMRKFYAYYAKNIRNAAMHRFDLVRATTIEEIEDIFTRIIIESPFPGDI